MRIVRTIKRIIVQSDFCTKPLFYGHHQNLNSILTRVRRE
ncbi:hypothetical protein LEP1GSC013_0268 [Leptospira interrogans serovar Valbuzzi str. Duyster]|nr:hypothetical protein LEP1GSC013_0268 [Leptospira interrogans serovar Valbuzzi str. Duyster]ENO74169.1 hypothetical protein LEP1GSC012_1933 [Leptospira interrogans serovar Valbuzzi str. Valbuzzi]